MVLREKVQDIHRTLYGIRFYLYINIYLYFHGEDTGNIQKCYKWVW